MKCRTSSPGTPSGVMRMAACCGDSGIASDSNVTTPPASAPRSSRFVATTRPATSSRASMPRAAGPDVGDAGGHGDAFATVRHRSTQLHGADGAIGDAGGRHIYRGDRRSGGQPRVLADVPAGPLEVADDDDLALRQLRLGHRAPRQEQAPAHNESRRRRVTRCRRSPAAPRGCRLPRGRRAPGRQRGSRCRDQSARAPSSA